MLIKYKNFNELDLKFFVQFDIKKYLQTKSKNNKKKYYEKYERNTKFTNIHHYNSDESII